MGGIAEISSSVIDFKKGVCAVCKKKQVTHWCDFVTKYRQNKYFFRRWQDFKEANAYGTQNSQCNLPMCEDCATQQEGDMHLCPHHQNLLEQAEQPTEYLRMRQKRETYEINSQTMKLTPLEQEDMNDDEFYFKVKEVVEENLKLKREKESLKKENKDLRNEVEDYRAGQMRLF